MMTDMPLESIDYDVFDYKSDGERSLSLEEAIRKADELRRSNSRNFYRVNPIDSSMSGFRVDEVPKQRAYAEALARWSNLLNKMLFRVH
jgi:hypothetical protein